MISRAVSALLAPLLRWRVVQLILWSFCLSATAQAAPQILVSIKPLQLLAAAITDGVTTPELVVEGGHDPHHMSLRPSDRRRLQQADIALWIGPALEIPLQDVMAGLSATVVTAQRLPQISLRDADGSIDPHLWLDSGNAAHIAASLAETLQQLDPANAARYRDNLEAFTQVLHQTDQQITDLLAPHRARPWAASHQAFAYLVAQFGLQQPSTLTDSSGNEPGVRRVMQLREEIAAQQIQCLLTETSENPAKLEALLAGTQLRVVAADVIGNEIAATASGYPELMLTLARQLASCLGGDA